MESWTSTRPAGQLERAASVNSEGGGGGDGGGEGGSGVSATMLLILMMMDRWEETKSKEKAAGVIAFLVQTGSSD